MSTYITIEPTSPWAIKLSALSEQGYSYEDVCYSCTNGEQTITRQIKIRQKMNC